MRLTSDKYRVSTVTRLIAIVVFAMSLAACGGDDGGDGPGETPTRSAPAPVHPLTGEEPSSNPVVAVKIDDTEASRPQRGINQADIVYVEEAEGGLTRLLAVYSTTLPKVEPVRSVRPSDLELVLQYGPIAFVASGGAPQVLALLDRSPLKTAFNDRGAPGFERDPDRPAPYNVIADLNAIADDLDGPRAKDIGLVWSERLVNPSSASGTAVNTKVGGTAMSFTWEAQERGYVRTIDGTRQQDTDGRLIATPNVVVQFCRITPYRQVIDSAGNPAQFTHTLGSGRAVVFRDGIRIEGTWERAEESDGTQLRDQQGNPIALAPGGAWFLLVPTNAALN